MSERRWPTPAESAEKIRRHIIDDRTSARPPYDLTDEEILGEPPERAGAPNASGQPARASRTPKQTRRSA